MYIGHQKQQEIFRRAVKNDKLMHAYIFSGVKGIGKRRFAINVAKAIMCEKKSFFTDCDCQYCTQTDLGTNPDLHIYEEQKTSPNGKVLNEDTAININNVRKIIESVAMTPFSAKYKAYIIDNADKLTDSFDAATALLKTLEEPSENTIFFLITDKFDTVLHTIRSRCIHIRFSPLKQDEVVKITKKLYPECTYIDRAALMSGGSVSKTIDIINEKFIDVTTFIQDNDYVSFIDAVLKMKTQDEITNAITALFPEVLKRFKETGKYSYCQLGYYLMEILRRFNYNGNIDLIKADFSAQVIETFNE